MVVTLWRNAGTKPVEEPCGRVGYTIIPLNVPDFYKYRTSVIAYEVAVSFSVIRQRRKRKKGHEPRRNATSEQNSGYFTIHTGVNSLSATDPNLNLLFVLVHYYSFQLGQQSNSSSGNYYSYICIYKKERFIFREIQKLDERNK